MSEKDVVEAFLSQEPAESSPLATDGERLHMSAAVIAEWSREGLVVTPENQGALHEQVKDRLVQAVLMRMAEQQPMVAFASMAASRRVVAQVIGR